MFMQNLDSTVIATALPTIAQSLGESPLTLNVAITCYLLSLAVFIPISGWTADRFGARRVFSLAIVVFTLGSDRLRHGSIRSAPWSPPGSCRGWAGR